MVSYNKYTDEQLVQLMSSDNSAAFNELYNRYWEKLLVKAGLLLDIREDAEEVIHDLFVSLWNRRSHIQLKYSFATYVSASLRYALYTFLASRKHKASRMITSIDSLQPQPDLEHTPVEWLEFEELQDKIEKAISALPEKCQLVFRLSREHGLTDKQIAHQLSISAKTVQNHMTAALKKLRSSLGMTYLFL